MKPLYDTPEVAAKKLGITTGYLRKCAIDGLIPQDAFFMTGGGQCRYKFDKVEQFFQNNTQRLLKAKNIKQA